MPGMPSVVRRILAVAELLRIVSIAVHAEPGFGDQSRREDMNVVDRAAVGVLNAGAFKAGAANAARSTIDSVDRSIGSNGPEKLSRTVKWSLSV